MPLILLPLILLLYMKTAILLFKCLFFKPFIFPNASDFFENTQRIAM